VEINTLINDGIAIVADPDPDLWSRERRLEGRET
jgi:hypothetical protein